MPDQTRRDFLKFLGLTASTSLIPLSSKAFSSSPTNHTIPSLKATFDDDLVLAKGFNYSPLISWGDKISSTDTFGFNCDYTAFILLSKNNGLFVVNPQ